MPEADDLYRRWLDDETEGRRLEQRRNEARRACDRALAELENRGSHAAAATELARLEEILERSLAFYLGHTANDAEFLRHAFGAERARELGGRLSQRKLSLLAELDRVRARRAALQRESPDREGPVSP